MRLQINRYIGVPFIKSHGYHGSDNFRFLIGHVRLVELSENPELRATTIDQAKSTGYFMKLRD